jgi:hypothetical protein
MWVLSHSLSGGTLRVTACYIAVNYTVAGAVEGARAVRRGRGYRAVTCGV